MLPQLRERFQAIEDRRNALLTKLAGLSEDQLRYHPKPGSWSLLQVAEHLVLLEELVYAAMTKDNRPIVRRRWWHKIGEWLLSLVLKYQLRVPAPTKRIVPVADTPLEDIRRHWESVRDRFRTFLEASTPESVQRLGLRHPVSGPYDIPGTLEFVAAHFDHHLNQIRRIEASAARR